jgi:ribonuclease BN (tRNA processing enzyme)
VLIDTGPHRLPLDCGASPLTAMTWQGVEPASIDAVVISHHHADHHGGFPFLILDV